MLWKAGGETSATPAGLATVIVPPLRDDQVGGTDFVLAEWTDAGESSAERPIAPLHLHRNDDEAWYVLEGTLGFVRGDERLEAPAGSAVLVPRGVVHTYWNAGPGRARYVIVMTRRIAALIGALHEPGALDDLPSLFARFDSELA
jgi:mannose-6-phosphate isomerase-like protein (cupin superfamily)